MSITRKDFDQEGYEQIVPLVTREDKNHQKRYGLLFSLGFVPYIVKHPTCRQRIEKVDRQKFVGFVSKMTDLKNDSFFQGNAYQAGRLLYTCADLEDMAKSSELLNR
jgi:cytochrome oxidase assembly protein ShyY1